MAGPLKNAKHEAFCQAFVRGENTGNATACYKATYRRDDRKAASKLRLRDDVSRRIDELSQNVADIERHANQLAAERLSITKEAVLAELAKIGFADIRKAVEWRGSLVREQDNPEGGEVLVVKEIVTNHVRLVDSDKLPADIAAAIAEVRQSPTGGVSIKFHDKQAALVNIGKHLGMFVERKVSLNINADALSDAELAEYIQSGSGEDSITPARDQAKLN